MRTRAVTVALALFLGCTETIRVGPQVEREDAGSVDGATSEPPVDARREDARCDELAESALPVSRRTATVIFALDRSETMLKRPAPNQPSRLESMYQSVLDVVDGHARSVYVGLEEFPFPRPGCTDGQGCCAGDVYAPDVNGSELLRDAFGCRQRPPACFENGPAVPTADALRRVRTFFDAAGPLYTQRNVVLITGGDPTCSIEGEPCQKAVDEAARLGNDDVQLTVVAYGEEAREASCPGRLARAAGADDRLAAADAKSLSDQLNVLFDRLADETCKVVLGQVPQDPDRVMIRVKGQLAPRGSGWTYDQGSTTRITIRGSFCEQIKRERVRVDAFNTCLRCGAEPLCQ